MATPPTTLVRPYCTLEQVQQETRNTQAEVADLFLQCINRASRAIERMCGRDFWYHDHTNGVGGEGPYVVPKSNVIGKFLYLPFEVLTLTKVEQAGSSYTDEYEELTLADDDYFLDTAKPRLVMSTASAWGDYPFTGKIRLTGTFGYAVTAPASGQRQQPPALLPAELSQACSLIAAAWSGEYRKERIGLDGSTQSVLETEIPDEAIRLLAPFRLTIGRIF